ncbi:MAG: cupin [Candidatus Aenigmatarchaeota archaeon]|nr:MAG: cupin [Candidatus Aenigmarchaeota archaeon]
MKISVSEFPRKVKAARDNETYSVYDLVFLDHLNVSLTVLHPGKSTKGHKHPGDEEEVYFFVQGEGEMQLDEEKFSVKQGDVVLIEKKKFHRVFNTAKKELIFLCVFEKYKGRGK